MFICKGCHWWSQKGLCGLMKSYGRCESCSNVGVCDDCHCDPTNAEYEKHDEDKEVEKLLSEKDQIVDLLAFFFPNFRLYGWNTLHDFSAIDTISDKVINFHPAITKGLIAFREKMNG